MINRIVLVGRLVADPEVRTTNSGITVASMRMAVDRPYRDKEGNKQTDFINVTAWRKLAELCRDYLSKGRLIGVDGSLQTRQYQDRDGNKRTAYEVLAENVQFLEPKSAGGGNYAKPPGPDDNDVPPDNADIDPPQMEDDLPF